MGPHVILGEEKAKCQAARLDRQFWSLYEPKRIGIDPLLAGSGTTCGIYTTLERHWDAPGSLLAFEARLAYLEKTPATEVSDGSTCTQGAIPGNRAGSSRHPHMAKRPSLERLRNFRQS